MGHHKAASCSIVPSFTSDRDNKSVNQEQQSSSTAKKRTINTHMSKKQQLLFPLPSFCLYSKKALLNEYTSESDIIQFLSPSSNSVLNERLPMFVGVLQSLFTAVNDLPFIDDDPEVDNYEYDDDSDGQQENERLSTSPFTIIGLNSMKLVIWNNMYDLIKETTSYKKDLCLVVFVSSQLKDSTIIKNMNFIQHDPKLTSSKALLTANELGILLIPLIEYWFNS
ncbi:MAG: hypothetical protein EXX96DRAFT_577880 [Benjaminiella poitrasii]|nr:MAG: hypothetical protein EXX96DRAFT_577880 [Benjaminiella poitrasii]